MEIWQKALEKVKQMDRADAIISVKPGYAHKIVTLKPEIMEGLSREEILVLAAGEIPPFGGSIVGNQIKIYTD